MLVNFPQVVCYCKDLTALSAITLSRSRLLSEKYSQFTRFLKFVLIASYYNSAKYVIITYILKLIPDIHVMIPGQCTSQIPDMAVGNL